MRFWFQTLHLIHLFMWMLNVIEFTFLLGNKYFEYHSLWSHLTLCKASGFSGLYVVPPPQFKLGAVKLGHQHIASQLKRDSFLPTFIPEPRPLLSTSFTAADPVCSICVCVRGVCLCVCARSHGSAGWLVAIMLRRTHLIVGDVGHREGSLTHTVESSYMAFIKWMTCFLTENKGWNPNYFSSCY